MQQHLDLLLSEAKKLHGENITPCSNKTFIESITETKKNFILWYNDSSDSTCIIAMDKHTKKIEPFKKLLNK